MEKGEIVQNFTYFHHVFYATCILKSFNPLPDDEILDRSNLKQSANDNFKFYENSRKLSKQVENTESKGEIARYECFQKTCFLEASKGVIMWK